MAQLPLEVALSASDVIAQACLDPWNFQRQPDEPSGDHHAHRTASFGDGGLLTFLILEHAAEVHVTSITWLG